MKRRNKMDIIKVNFKKTVESDFKNVGNCPEEKDEIDIELEKVIKYTGRDKIVIKSIDRHGMPFDSMFIEPKDVPYMALFLLFSIDEANKAIKKLNRDQPYIKIEENKYVLMFSRVKPGDREFSNCSKEYLSYLFGITVDEYDREIDEWRKTGKLPFQNVKSYG